MRLTTDSVRSAMVQLQEKVSNQSINTSEVGDTFPPVKSRSLDRRSPKAYHYSAITGAIQRLEKLSRANYINRAELELCLLSRSTLSRLVLLLPTSEHDLWVREMTMAGLDFKNSVDMKTFNCFKKVCIIEINRNLEIRICTTRSSFFEC